MKSPFVFEPESSGCGCGARQSSETFESEEAETPESEDESWRWRRRRRRWRGDEPRRSFRRGRRRFNPEPFEPDEEIPRRFPPVRPGASIRPPRRAQRRSFVRPGRPVPPRFSRPGGRARFPFRSGRRAPFRFRSGGRGPFGFPSGRQVPFRFRTGTQVPFRFQTAGPAPFGFRTRQAPFGSFQAGGNWPFTFLPPGRRRRFPRPPFPDVFPPTPAFPFGYRLVPLSPEDVPPPPLPDDATPIDAAPEPAAAAEPAEPAQPGADGATGADAPAGDAAQEFFEYEDEYENGYEYEDEYEDESFEGEWEGEEEGEVNRSSREYGIWVQKSLNKILGLRLALDGVIGAQARSAIRSFQQQQGLRPDGAIGSVTEAALIRAGAGNPPQSSGAASSMPSGPVDIVNVRGIRVARQIASNVDALLAAAAAEGVRLGGGGYRSPQQQIELRRKHCGPTDYDIYHKPSSQCHPPTATPGHSNHERGLAIDFTYNGGGINSHDNPAFRWLAANAQRFGLYNLPSEPWHWSVDGR